MNRTDAFNALLLVLALAGAVAAMTRPGANPAASSSSSSSANAAQLLVEDLAGEPALRDATGALVPLRHYTRIVSASTVADALLLELAEPTRIAAFTDFSSAKVWDAHRFAGKPSIAALNRLEPILEVKPDLVLVSALSDRAKAARLREAGLNVFDLGPMEGLASLDKNIAALGLLLGAPERAQRFSESLQRRLAALARDIDPAKRRRAMYLSVYGTQLYGGAAKTSFHDVLNAAGLHDVAAEQYRGWPLLAPEQVLELDPEIIVTNDGMARPLCQNPGLERLRACRRPGGIVSLPEWLLGDPGPSILVAAEHLNAMIYRSKSDGNAH